MKKLKNIYVIIVENFHLDHKLSKRIIFYHAIVVFKKTMKMLEVLSMYKIGIFKKSK